MDFAFLQSPLKKSDVALDAISASSDRSCPHYRKLPTEANALSSLCQLFTKNQSQLAIVIQTQLKATSHKLYNWLI